jgi:hypothetical protein
LLHPKDAVVGVVRNVEVTVRINSKARWAAELCHGRDDAFAVVATNAIAGYCGDYFGCIHFADAMITCVCYVQISCGVKGNSIRIVELGCCGGTKITAESSR